MADYIPKAVAAKDWKVADKAWKPELPADTAKIEDLTDTTFTAQYAEDKTGQNPTTVDDSNITPVNPTDEKQGTGIKVINPDRDTKVTAKDEDGKDVPAVINPTTGEIEVKPGTDVDGPITVTVSDPDIPGGKKDVEVPVSGHTKGQDDNNNGKPGNTSVDDSNVKPVDPTDEKQGTGIIVNKPDGDTDVTAKDEDGKDVPAVINPTTGEIEVKPGTNVDGPIIVTVTDPDLPGGKKDITVPVNGHEAGRDDNHDGYPSRPTYKYTTLTLDENYRSGEITHHEVLEGELIERYLYVPRRRGYVFEGWSYNSRRLDEVRPGDRICYPTTLYAIWAKDRDYDGDEREVEPEDLRPVHDHNAYMFGYTDGTVRPNGKITRAEAAALVTRLLGLDTFASAAKPVFSDTPSSWYNKAINAAVDRGIMKGYPDGRFRPNAPITRAEFTQMISTIDNKPYGVAPFADVKGHWAERAIGSEYQAGRIMGYPDQTFRPNAFITRCEAVVILNKIFQRNYDAMSLKDAKNAYLIKGFIDLPTSFWGYYDMIEATNSHSFKRRNEGKVQEDWTLVK